ncbi:hypothetical protein CIHG_10386 [Coccidioides immitis H538.4]|uniref:Uncharacterized protein n=2 Tax=Coccidioides immitis TaxID=5501 RepID=A0A0J8S6W4_COCIT|nr:hypothetical protein CIRG_05022 [Coccidioides immitis RMSCC 2394]KMU92606.1 hypothetical protein CIHG_10386 [Coccidioides immitis H538.4]
MHDTKRLGLLKLLPRIWRPGFGPRPEPLLSTPTLSHWAPDDIQRPYQDWIHGSHAFFAPELYNLSPSQGVLSVVTPVVMRTPRLRGKERALGIASNNTPNDRTRRVSKPSPFPLQIIFQDASGLTTSYIIPYRSRFDATFASNGETSSEVSLSGLRDISVSNQKLAHQLSSRGSPELQPASSTHGSRQRLGKRFTS